MWKREDGGGGREVGRKYVGREILHDREKEKAMCSSVGLRGPGDTCTTYLISLAKTALSQGCDFSKIRLITRTDHSLVPKPT